MKENSRFSFEMSSQFQSIRKVYSQAGRHLMSLEEARLGILKGKGVGERSFPAKKEQRF